MPFRGVVDYMYVKGEVLCGSPHQSLQSERMARGEQVNSAIAELGSSGKIYRE